MKVLLQQVHIIDPSSTYHDTTNDIFIENGYITKIATSIGEQVDRTVSGNDLHVSPGWLDIFSNFGDPGYEFKETLDTGARAAAAGGFTDVFVIPNTKPAIDTKSQVEYIRRRSETLPVNIYPIGAVSKNTEGKDLAEMYDMLASGAIAFSDGLNPVQSAGILLKALQYVKAFDGVIIQIPDDKSVGTNGLMHEGIVSTRLGLPGKPMMAEELLVARDIKLARYAGSKLHFTGVTSPKSIEYIRRAKDAGIQVSCSVTPYHIYFSDEELVNYDTNLKVYPPLRSKKDVGILRDAITDGTIDCISTHHMPHEYDSKIVEFEYAKNGMIGLETCYSVLKTALPGISETRWVELLSINPRKIFGLPQPSITTEQEAILTIYEPNTSRAVEASVFQSKSKNSPFIGRSLNGSIHGIIRKEHLFLNP
jgi:dihydroorotase